MGLLSRLFGNKEAAAAPSAVVLPQRSTIPARYYAGDETLEVVGESFHQDTLWALVGGRTTEYVREPIRAVLVPEPDNPEDRNAIMVTIDGYCVGHLSRTDAAAYLPGLQRLSLSGPVELAGVIVGGSVRRDGIGLLGVFLDHDPRDFRIPGTGRAYGSQGIRTGFSEAVATDVDDDSYDLSWHVELAEDHPTAVAQLRRLMETETNPIDRHYMWIELTQRLYKCSDRNPNALNEFDAACEQHHSEMATIRPALVAKFGGVPVIDTYRQAVIRRQKAKDWQEMRVWAEYGLAAYGDQATRPEVVDDLAKRLAYAIAKLAGPPTPRSTPRKSASTTTVVVETLVCVQCGASFERVRARGRKPQMCPDCRAA